MISLLGPLPYDFEPASRFDVLACFSPHDRSECGAQRGANTDIALDETEADTQTRADADPVRQARCSTSDDDAKGFEEAVDVVGTAIWCEPESDAAGFAESEPSRGFESVEGTGRCVDVELP